MTIDHINFSTSKSKKLAIHGGTPVRSAPMPTRQALGKNETKMIAECIAYYQQQRVDPGYQGFFEDQYCQAFVEYMGGGYADAVATGTAALYVAIAALDLPKGSEVLVSPITDPGTLSAIVLNGLTPKLMDSMEGSYNVGCEQMYERIDSKTSAVLIVHSVGQAAPIDKIVDIAHQNGLKVLEDCSQAHGATCNNRMVGTFGDIAAFSTMYRKAHITGGCGGIVYSDNLDLFHLALAYADRGKPSWNPDFDERDPRSFLFPALNLHTDEISCAVGIASLNRITESIKKRREFVSYLEQGLDASNVCRRYPASKGDSPFIYPVIVNEDLLRCNKLDFAKAILAEGIPLNPRYTYLVRDWEWLHPYLADDFDPPNARKVINSSFCLYLNEAYSRQEAEDCANAILKVEEIMRRY